MKHKINKHLIDYILFFFGFMTGAIAMKLVFESLLLNNTIPSHDTRFLSDSVTLFLFIISTGIFIYLEKRRMNKNKTQSILSILTSAFSGMAFLAYFLGLCDINGIKVNLTAVFLVTVIISQVLVSFYHYSKKKRSISKDKQIDK